MEVKITNGQNIIQLLSDNFASCLVVEAALTVNWPDCQGSVGEYFALSNYSSDKRKTLTNSLNQSLINGNETEIYKLIKKFLTLFSNGNYQVKISNIRLDFVNFKHEGQADWNVEVVPEDERFSGAFYPSYLSDKTEIFFTIPNSSIDKDRVEFYKELIQNGSRPKVITYELFDNNHDEFTAMYLIDGHHKAKAYLELGIDIPTVSILKVILKTEREVTLQTQSILNASAPILKDFEFEHLLIQNEDNLENVNFVDDIFLTSKLDKVLKKNSKLERGILNLFLKLDKSQDERSTHWLIGRLNNFSENITIGNGLVLYCDKRSNAINNLDDFNNWINKTLPNNGYNA